MPPTSITCAMQPVQATSSPSWKNGETNCTSDWWMPAMNGSLMMNTSPGLMSSPKRSMTSLITICIRRSGSM